MLTTTAVGYVYNVKSGEQSGGDQTGLTPAEGTLSLLGSLSQQYIPLFAMSSAPHRVEIQLVDIFYKACCDLTSTGAADCVTIATINCEYVANFIEMGVQGMSVI